MNNTLFKKAIRDTRRTVSVILCTLASSLPFMEASASQVTSVAPTADPVADPLAMVTEGKARFTVLTDRLIRMEWSEDSVFEDNATLGIINRRLDVPSYKVGHSGDVMTLRTERLTLKYRGHGRFTKDNLSVSFKMNGKTVTWTPGDDPKGNLMGTTRTLDGCIGFEKISSRDNYIEPGILSRDGWAIVDESSRHLLVNDGSDWGEWVKERKEGDRQDLYIFAYGHDYKAALAAFTSVAGKVPLPPRYTLGYWWSRYWAYTDTELLEIGSEMRRREIPMDVFIIDMDWHLTWKDADKRLGHDEFGQRRGWTGYSWNHDLIPDPDGLLSDLHGMNYKLALNLHPASGIRPYEDCYENFVLDYLSRTDDYDGPQGYVYGDEPYQFKGVEKACGHKGHRAPVPFRLSQQAWADAYFNSVIHPLEKQGVDFWWLDWQQWREDRYVKDLSNTFWCNWCFFNDKVRQTKSLGADAPRPLIYHRWGGLGSHRYQLGFSGDTYCKWSVLEFLPYFTATASNVCYGYWGHDIGGHMMMKSERGNPVDPEMFTRWLQYGVFTPIFKTHSTSRKNLERRIWMFPDHYEYMRDAILLRYALTPYIYDAARQSYDTGVCITRPLYYDYPETEEAYARHQEFFFGDNILATVLCSPAGPDGKTGRQMWFPSGSDWYDMAAHTMRRGGTTQTLYYTIDQNPWFVKAGSIIPLAAEGIQNLQGTSDQWRLLLVPGKGKSSYVHYEDDGVSCNYASQYATTTITKTESASTAVLRIGARQGTYKGMGATRKIALLFEGRSRLPKSVRLSCSSAAVTDLDATIEGTAVKIQLPESPASEEMSVTIVF